MTAIIEDWRPFFPFPVPRPEQVTVLDKCVRALASENKKFIVLELGTGVGKSAIAVCLARWLAAHKLPNVDNDVGGAIITSQKTLQDQYTSDFSLIAADLRSSSNYECRWADGITCAETLRISRASGGWPCKTEQDCKQGLECPYKLAKKRYAMSHVGITNYSYLLSESTYAGILKPRQLLVLDEAHRIEDEIRRWATVQVDDEICADLNIKLPKDTVSDDAVHKWMDTVYKIALATAIIDLEKQIMTHSGKRKKLPAQLRGLARQYEFLDKKQCQLTRYLSDQSGSRSEFLVVRGETQSSGRSIEIKPLDIAASAHDVLYSRGERILMMSATILDFESFAKTCGLPVDRTVFIDVPSPFNAQHFGIVYRPVAAMNRDGIDAAIPDIIKQIKRILADHPNEKGILHASNYKITQAIGQIDDDRLLVQSSSKDRARILEEHISSKKPTVLVSPAMMEGLDLHDDLGRFQVICKVPFPFLGDPVVKKLLARSQRWYAWRTALTLVQAVGRCVRNEDDWAKTYILDTCFGDFFARWTTFFTDAFSAMEIDATAQVSQPIKKKTFNKRW